MPLQCPYDSSQLAGETFHGVNLDVCPTCKGIWFGEGELRALLSYDQMALSDLQHIAVPPVEQKSAGVSTVECPVCRATLEHYHYLYDSPVILDSCPNGHGFWVRHTELLKMQQVLDSAKSPPSVQEQAKIALGLAAADHEAFMIRQRNIQTFFFNMLRRHPPGWIGFI